MVLFFSNAFYHIGVDIKIKMTFTPNQSAVRPQAIQCQENLAIVWLFTVSVRDSDR